MQKFTVIFSDRKRQTVTLRAAGWDAIMKRIEKIVGKGPEYCTNYWTQMSSGNREYVIADAAGRFHQTVYVLIEH